VNRRTRFSRTVISASISPVYMLPERRRLLFRHWCMRRPNSISWPASQAALLRKPCREAVAIIGLVATDHGASTLIGANHARAAWATSSPNASWPARKAASNSAASAAKARPGWYLLHGRDGSERQEAANAEPARSCDGQNLLDTRTIFHGEEKIDLAGLGELALLSSHDGGWEQTTGLNRVEGRYAHHRFRAALIRWNTRNPCTFDFSILGTS
jgi:hypothetical protein